MLEQMRKFLKQFVDNFIKDLLNDIYTYGVFITAALLAGIATSNIDDLNIAWKISVGIIIMIIGIAFRIKDKG